MFWMARVKVAVRDADATYPICYGIGVAALAGIRLWRNYARTPAS